MNFLFSDVIRKWAEPPRRRVGPFTTSKMEETYIRDLTVRLGYPYVYVHQVLIEISKMILVFYFLIFFCILRYYITTFLYIFIYTGTSRALVLFHGCSLTISR